LKNIVLFLLSAGVKYYIEADNFKHLKKGGGSEHRVSRGNIKAEGTAAPVL